LIGSKGIWNLRKIDTDKIREQQTYKQRIFNGNGKLFNHLKRESRLLAGSLSKVFHRTLFQEGKINI